MIKINLLKPKCFKTSAAKEWWECAPTLAERCVRLQRFYNQWQSYKMDCLKRGYVWSKLVVDYAFGEGYICPPKERTDAKD